MQTTKPVRSPRKQRKLLHNAPAHIRHKLMAAPLSPQLTASKSVKTLPVRKGDTVQIMRGDNKGFEGKISRVDLRNYRVYLEGLTREKVDGTTIFIPIHPSKIMIKNLNLSDKWRKAIVERKEDLAKQAVKAEKAQQKSKKTLAKKTPVKAVTVKKETKKALKEEPHEAKAKPASKEKLEKIKQKSKAPTAKTKKKTEAKRKATSKGKKGGE